MTTKIILSLAIIGIAGVIAVGGTMAYFSDTATSTSNSFMAGTLDLQLSDDNSTYSQSITGTFEMDNMVPGGAGTEGTVWVKNTGNVPADHIRITSVVNTPSDNGINEPECKAYSGEWKSGFSHGWCCVIPSYDITTCANVGGTWGNTGTTDQCYAEDADGFKDDWNTRNDIDKYLQVTSIMYNGQELKFSGGNVVVDHAGHDARADYNGNGYLDLDDLEKVAKDTTSENWLDNLKPVSEPHTFKMTVKLHESAGNVYQTDKNGIKITFQLNQDSSQ